MNEEYSLRSFPKLSKKEYLLRKNGEDSVRKTKESMRQRKRQRTLEKKYSSLFKNEKYLCSVYLEDEDEYEKEETREEEEKEEEREEQTWP